MTLKKFALRGMIVLAAVIALCVLFSGTFRTLTTPKVRLEHAKNGKMESSTVLMGKVVFPEEEEMNIQVPEELTLTVRRLYVTPGQQISKGDRMIAAEVTDGNKKLLELQAQYVKVRDTLDNWDRKHGDIRLSRNEEAWIDAYNAAREAEDKELELRHALMANLGLKSSNDLNETTVKKFLKTLKQKASQQAIIEQYNNWMMAKNAMTEAQKKLKGLDRYAVEDSVWTTLQEKNDKIKEKAEIEDKMMAIRQLQKQVSEIAAPHDGYVIEVKVQKDAVLTSGEAELFLISPEDKGPVLRAELTDKKKNVQKGAVVSIPVSDWFRVESKVTATGLTKTGVPYADIKIPDDLSYRISNLFKDGEEIKMKATVRDKENSTLIPVAAVRGSGENRYVYIGRPQQSLFGDTTYVVDQVEFRVLGENDKYVSTDNSDLGYSSIPILYMEDREIQKDSVVMAREGKE
ncbi:MAG: hypothetical protein J6Y48_10190 [Clostridia bacterium]|nr:hypothetical protein [Clostridia bacterium]